MKIGFIGLGNMAGAMIGGLLKCGLVRADDIYGVDIKKAGALNGIYLDVKRIS